MIVFYFRFFGPTVGGVVALATLATSQKWYGHTTFDCVVSVFWLPENYLYRENESTGLTIAPRNLYSTRIIFAVSAHTVAFRILHFIRSWRVPTDITYHMKRSMSVGSPSMVFARAGGGGTYGVIWHPYGSWRAPEMKGTEPPQLFAGALKGIGARLDQNYSSVYSVCCVRLFI